MAQTIHLEPNAIMFIQRLQHGLAGRASDHLVNRFDGFGQVGVMEIKRDIASESARPHHQVTPITAPVFELLNVRQAQRRRLSVRLKLNAFRDDGHGELRASARG
jgi:hypothetical protein